MQVGAALRKRPGVAEASCIMATPANLAQLQHAELSVDADVHPGSRSRVTRLAGPRTSHEQARPRRKGPDR
jgi:hypothetical protein